METGETPTQKQGRLARLQFVVDRVRRIQHLAMLILLVMIALTLISSDHASKQFGVGESSTESTTTITVQIQLASLTPVEITLNDAGVYDVEGFACITGDTLFINGAPLPSSTPLLPSLCFVSRGSRLRLSRARARPGVGTASSSASHPARKFSRARRAQGTQSLDSAPRRRNACR
jgi:hypothetical protein